MKTDPGHELPKGWRWVKLGEITEFIYGDGLPAQKRRSGSVPVYGSNGLVGYHDTPLTSEASIVIGRKGSIGEVHFIDVPCWPIDTTYFIEQKHTKADLRWLAWALKFARLPELNRAAAIPGLNRQEAYAIEVPFPPFESQRSMAVQLSEQMTAVERARKAAEERFTAIDSLVEAYLRESLSSKTQRLILEDGLIEITQGVGQRWQEYPVIGATRDGVAAAKEGVGKNPMRYKLVTPETILYNPMRINIGSIAMVDTDDTPGITSPDYVVIKGKSGAIHHRWFYYWFRSYFGEAFIKSMARGAVRERLLFNRLKEGQIEVPDWETQLRTAQKLAMIPALKKGITDQISAINSLLPSLLRCAFTGSTARQ